jgi:hypothetical protein
MGWALIKAVSLAYLLGAVNLSLASLAWRAARNSLAPHRRAGVEYFALLFSAFASLGLSVTIAVGVVTHSIRMTTPYFGGLMRGNGALLITLSGWGVLLLSLALLLRSAWQARLPKPVDAAWNEAGLLLRRNPAIATASLAGVWRPELWVNPRYWDGLSAGDRELVLHHERLHLLRRDNLRKLVLHFIAGLYYALPWVRRWPLDYELDSELAVDDACRRELPEAAYRALVAGAVETATRFQPPVVCSAISQADLALRLRVLLTPRRRDSALLAIAMTALPVLLSSAPAVALLCNPISRCFFACYLGY